MKTAREKKRRKTSDGIKNRKSIFSRRNFCVTGKKKSEIRMRKEKKTPSILVIERRLSERKRIKIFFKEDFWVQLRRKNRVIQRLASMTFSVREKRENHQSGKVIRIRTVKMEDIFLFVK